MKKNSLLFLYVIPVALLLWFVASFSVNVPVHDQWRLVNLFEKIAGGNVNFGDFWALHSNHRIVFPKIIISALAFSSQWNINYELILSLIFAIITFALIYKLSANQVRNGRDGLFHLTNILTGFWLFSLVQHENWLWGFQLAWFLVNLCVMMAIFVLSLDDNLLIFRFNKGIDWRTAKTQRTQREEEEEEEEENKKEDKFLGLSPIWFDARLFIAAICCEIASFSSAQGLLSWLALIPAVVAVKGKTLEIRKRLGLWIFLFVVTSALYSIDYHPKREMSIISLLAKPLVVINYFFNLLGSPIVRLPVFSSLIGLGIFLIFLLLLFYFGKNNTANQEAAPWISLGLFSLLSAIFITVGRANFGANHAIESSRYTTVSIFLLMAIFQLGLIFMIDKIKEKMLISKLSYQFISGLLIGVILFNNNQAIAQAKSALIYRKSGANCLELIHYLEGSFFEKSPDSCLWVMTEKTELVREGAKILDRIGFRKIAKDIAFINHPTAVYGYLDDPQTADKSLSIKKSDKIRVAGWAIFPKQREQPNIVLLSYGNNQSFFANAYINLDSPDLAKVLNSNLYSQRRWNINFSANFLPVGETIITAWVYNPIDRQFVKLNGGAKVTVEEE
jgi:hypothetical protein